MSIHDKFSPSQIKYQKGPKKESEQLRQSLMKRAKQLKQKMYQQTNFFDYSINNLMNQTLKQIKKHKQQFKEKQDLLIYEEESQQTKRKKSLLKTQLLQNLQKCKNRYKKHIITIKNQKNRIYTDTKQQFSRQNVEEMLIFAKNKFKKEEEQKRNKSEILKVANSKKSLPIHTHNRTQNIINSKQNQKLYQKLLKVNENLTQTLEDPSSFPQLNEDYIKEVNRCKLDQLQNSVMDPKPENNQIFVPMSTSKKVLYSSYCRFPTQSRENKNDSKIENIISQRSVFVPLGKIIKFQRKQLQINNFVKKSQNISTNGKNQKVIEVNNKIVQSSIVDEEQDKLSDQGNQNNLQKEDNLPSKRLQTGQISKTKRMEKKSNTRRLNYLTQSSILQSQKMSRLKQKKSNKSDLMSEDVRGMRIITQLSPKFNQSSSKQLEQNAEDYGKRQIKIDQRIKGNISLGDSRFMFESTRRDSMLIKRTTFQNSKLKGLSKGMMKNPMRQRGDELGVGQLLLVSDYQKKMPNSKNLDVRGNNVRLAESIKYQKRHNPKGSNISDTSIGM